MSDFHDFAERLNWSQSGTVSDFWTGFYKQAFPTATLVEDCQQKPEFQKYGIDRRIHLPCGRKVKIDEKTRESTFDDILLEYMSVDTYGKKGWIEKELGIDYIAYGLLKTGRIYLLPYDLLCRAWQLNSKIWLCKAKAREDGFTHIISRNNGYQTYSVGVPRSVLFTALIDSASFDLDTGDPYKEEEIPFLDSVLSLFSGKVVSTTEEYR